MVPRDNLIFRVALLAISILALAAVYLFQYTDIAAWIFGTGRDEIRFIVNRSIRIILNDSFMIGVLYAIFYDKRIIKLAFLIQAIDLLILFPIYLLLKLPTEGTSEISSPFLSQFHRLIVNPTLMILLIPALIYQRIPKTSR